MGTVTKQGFKWSSEELLGKHFQAVFRSLDHEALPVKVNAALALTEMIIAHESGKFRRMLWTAFHFRSIRLVRKAVGPQVGKVVQGTAHNTSQFATSENDGHRFAQDVR